jgi:hypothetical protein
MATPCPQLLLPRRVEELGTVDAVSLTDGDGTRLDITFRPGDGVVSDADRAKIRAMMKPGDNFRIFRVTEFVYDSESEECVSVLKLRRCQYQQQHDIIVNGMVISTTKALGLQPGDRTLVGVCVDKLIELILGKASALVPSPVGLLSDADERGQPSDPAVLALLASLAPAGLVTAESMSTAISPRVSTSALVGILALGLEADEAAARVGELESVRFGPADAAVVANELERRGAEEDLVNATVLRGLAATPLRLGDRVSEADALLAAAASVRSRLAATME